MLRKGRPTFPISIMAIVMFLFLIGQAGASDCKEFNCSQFKLYDALDNKTGNLNTNSINYGKGGWYKTGYTSSSCTGSAGYVTCDAQGESGEASLYSVGATDIITCEYQLQVQNAGGQFWLGLGASNWSTGADRLASAVILDNDGTVSIRAASSWDTFTTVNFGVWYKLFVTYNGSDDTTNYALLYHVNDTVVDETIGETPYDSQTGTPEVMYFQEYADAAETIFYANTSCWEGGRGAKPVALPSYTLPDNVASGDWISPQFSPWTDNPATLWLNWTASTSSNGSALNYTLLVDGSKVWSGIDTTQYEWSPGSDATYTLRVDVHDNGTFVTGDNRTYTHDTVSPAINFITPLSDNSTNFATSTLNITIQFSDANCIYAYNVSVKNSSGYVHDYNQSINVTGGPEEFNLSFLADTSAQGFIDVLDVKADVTDCHTKKDIKALNNWKDKSLSKVGFDLGDSIVDIYTDEVKVKGNDGKVKKTKKKDIDYEVVKGKDRYSYKVKTGLNHTPGDTYEFTHTVFAYGGLTEMPNTGWPGHMVIGDGLGKGWIDFDSTDLIGSVSYGYKNKKEMTVTYESASPEPLLESIGLLNNRTVTVKVTFDNQPPHVTMNGAPYANGTYPWTAADWVSANPRINTRFNGIKLLNFPEGTGQIGNVIPLSNVTINGTQYEPIMSSENRSDALAWWWRVFTLPAPDLAAGSYNITLWANDTVGNYHEAHTIWTLLRAEPSLNITLNGEHSNITVPRNFSVSFVGGGGTVANVPLMLFVNGTKVNTSEGSVSFSAAYVVNSVINVSVQVNESQNYTGFTFNRVLTVFGFNFTVTAEDNFTGSNIQTFRLNLYNGSTNNTYDTATGSIVTDITDTAGLFNVTVSSNESGGYYPRFYPNLNMSGGLTSEHEKYYRLYELNLSGITFYQGNNYSRNLSYQVNYTCRSDYATIILPYANGAPLSPLISHAANCTNQTAVTTGTYNRAVEGPFNFSVYLEGAYDTNVYVTPNQTIITDVLNPTATVSMTATAAWGTNNVTIGLTCVDNVFLNLTYNLSFNGAQMFFANLTNNTEHTNQTIPLDGSNLITGVCSDPWGQGSTTLNQSAYVKSFILIDERNNSPFDVNNITSAIIYYDDNSSFIDLQNDSHVNFTSLGQVKMRVELGYADGTIITRWIDVTVPPDSEIRICANREGVTHYEQLIFSTTEKRVILKSVFSNCLVAADYTRFAYQTAKILKAFTINNYYDLITYPSGVETILSSIDGSTQSTINLDTLQFAAEQEGLNVLGEALTFQKISGSDTMRLRYQNINDDNDALNITITNMDTNEIVYSSNSFTDPNSITLLFDYSTHNITNITQFLVRVKQTRDGEDTFFNQYFGTDGSTGIIPATVAVVISIFLLLFGLTMATTRTVMSWLGIIVTLASLVVLSVAVGHWTVTFMMAVTIITLVYIVISMVQESQAAVT